MFVNMISTADGRAARDGRTATLGSEADTELLVELRAIADAVLIGTGTLRAEGYARLMKREERRARRRAAGLDRGPARSDHLAQVRRAVGRRAVPGARAAGPGLHRRRGRRAARRPAPVEVVRLEVAGPAEMLADLRARGVRALLCEGGPTLHGALQAAGLVDELFLTIAPLITGDDDEPNIVEGGRLPEDVELELLSVERTGSEVFLRYGRAS